MHINRLPTRGHDRQKGQALVEFAITLPLLASAMMGVFEFGVAMAANIGINRAAQNGAHIASVAGNLVGADCIVLDEIERSVMVPNDRARIQSVRIELTDLSGDTVHAANTWDRTGSTECEAADGMTIDLPYTLLSEGYPDVQRCNVLGGCPTMSPPRTTVDNIAVVVSYNHQWITPLGSVLPLAGGEDGTGWTFEQRNVFRMEPHR